MKKNELYYQYFNYKTEGGYMHPTFSMYNYLNHDGTYLSGDFLEITGQTDTSDNHTHNPLMAYGFNAKLSLNWGNTADAISIINKIKKQVNGNGFNMRSIAKTLKKYATRIIPVKVNNKEYFIPAKFRNNAEAYVALKKSKGNLKNVV